jgi:hypothetical protein
MRRSGVGSGGGHGSRNIVEPRVKTGTGSRGTRPGGAAALGSVYGNHVTNRDHTDYRGPKFHDGKSFQPVKFGNEVALNVGGGGPGTGREVMASGSQGCHGQPAAGSPRPNRQRDALNNE